MEGTCTLEPLLQLPRHLVSLITECKGCSPEAVVGFAKQAQGRIGVWQEGSCFGKERARLEGLVGQEGLGGLVEVPEIGLR